MTAQRQQSCHRQLCKVIQAEPPTADVRAAAAGHTVSLDKPAQRHLLRQRCLQVHTVGSTTDDRETVPGVMDTHCVRHGPVVDHHVADQSAELTRRRRRRRASQTSRADMFVLQHQAVADIVAAAVLDRVCQAALLHQKSLWQLRVAAASGLLEQHQQARNRHRHVRQSQLRADAQQNVVQVVLIPQQKQTVFAAHRQAARTR